jgi:hypothetical protein
MATDDSPEWLRKRLDAIILLLLENSSGAPDSTSAKIERLIALGFSQPEVAQVVGKKLNYVTAVLAGKRKAANSARATE